MVTGGLCGARPPSRSVVRVAPARRCGFVGAGPAAAALTVSPFLLWVGAPPGPGGAEGRACGSPAGVGAGGGGGPPRSLSGLCGRGGGGGSGGGPSVPRRRPLSAKKGGGGGGRLGGPSPGGQPSARGVAPFPRPPPPSAGSSRGPSLGPLTSRPLPRGAGRPGVAVRVSGLWLSGCGAAFPR